MKTTFEAKTEEEVVAKAIRELKVTNEEIIMNLSEKEIGLFKGKMYELDVVMLDDVVKDIKEKILFITDLMGINVNVEFKQRASCLMFNLYSNESNVLIGKKGKNIIAIETVLKSYLSTEYKMDINIFVDALDYRKNKEEELKNLALSMYEEVIKTKVLIKLDDLSSSERKIIHECLENYDDVRTYSVGDDDKRALVIEYNK